MMALFQRKWVVVALTLLALVGGFIVYVLWPRPDELARWKAQMMARGEKFTLAEVAPKFSQEKLDWAKQLQGAVGGISAHPVPTSAAELMVSGTPGYAVPAWQRPFANQTAKTNHTWAMLAGQMAESSDALHALHELLRNVPAGSPTDYSDPVNLPGGFNFLTLRRVSQSLSLATVNDLHRGALPSALTNLHTLIALVRAMDEGGLLVEQMIRSAIASMAATATWEALQAPGCTDAQLAALQDAWARVELVRRMAATFEIERAWVTELFQYARTNSSGPGGIVRANSGGAGQFLKDQVVTPIWQKAWSKQDELIFQRALQPYGDGIRDAVTNRSWQRLRETAERAGNVTLTNLSALDEFRYQFAAAAVPNWSKALKSLLRHESQIQMARAAIAIERHRREHGRVPDFLTSLVPEFLRETPVDYMTGRPLLYAVNPDGSFALYSAGEDGRDDDGLGDDAAWPQAGSAAGFDLPRPGERIAWLSFLDVPPRDVLKNLARQVGLELRYQPTATNKLPWSFSMTLSNVTPAEALETALQRLHLALVRGPKHSNHCVVVEPSPRKQR